MEASTEHVTEYISEMTRQLAKLAREAGQGTLAFLLEMAAREAELLNSGTIAPAA